MINQIVDTSANLFDFSFQTNEWSN